MGKITMYAVVCLVVASGAMAQVGTSSEPPPPPTGTASTLELLNQRIPEVLFEELPLEQVMEFIADFTQMNVVVRWQILEDAGIERDKAITIKVRNVRLRQVLWLIMNEAGGTDLRLAYRASGNMLVLSTEEDLGEEKLVKVYDVSDLLVRPPRFTNALQLDATQALQQAAQGSQSGQGGGGGGGQGLFGGQGGSQQSQRDDERDGAGAGMQELLQLIVDTVEPDSWVQNGGLGTIQPFGNVLVVRNSILVHQRLSGYVEGGD
jgi:hypothetical protein